MLVTSNVFQKNIKLFIEQLTPVSAKSIDYAGIENDLDTTLLLADRILSACQEDLDFSRVKKIGEHLERLSNGDATTAQIAEGLLEDIELWFKVVLSFSHHFIWQSKKGDKNYTYSQVVRDLGLLKQAEIDLDKDSYHKISDQVTQLIFLAYRYRNPLTHSPEEHADHIKALFLPASICALIAPVHKYKSVIREALSSLIISPFTSPSHINILTLINSERQKHIMGFCGREKWLYELSQKLLTTSDSPKPYILLNGHEGMGKSALVAKLTEELSATTSAIGRNAGLVKKTAPWLPNLIIHFGKQSNRLYEIVDLLLAQINTLLLEPIDIEQAQISHKDFPQRELSQFGYLATEGLDRYTSKKTYLGAFPHEVTESMKAEAYDFTLYRRVLYLALEQVVKEKGSVILVVDAVDEISLDGSGLQFLPDPLPIGVSALLSARESRVVKWLENNRDVDVIRLKELEKNEISIFTNVRDEDGEMHSRFNNRVWKASGGWPLMVLEASKLAQTNPTDLDQIQIDRSKDSLFERRVNEWRSTNISNLPNASIDILKLLSTFESVAPVDLDLIQAFLERNGPKVSRDEIKQGLQQVSSQIEGLDANRIKLALKAFAEYIRERWLGKKDLLRTLEEIVEWLAKKEYDDPELLAQFLNYWTSGVHSKDVRKAAEKLIDYFFENSDADTLFRIFRGLRKLSKDTPIISDIAIRCLQSSADLKNTSAMLHLGWRLLDGKGLDKNLGDGKLLLESAALSGDEGAMIILANRLLDGKGLDQNIEEGKLLLIRAIELGNERAKYAYAIRLLEGHNFEQNIYQGEKLLRELFDQGYKPGAFDLADRLIEGNVIEKDIESGEKILRDLCENSDSAQLLLANRLIDGDGLQINVTEGETILRRLVNKGNKRATFVLGSRLHYGKGLVKNVDESLKLLHKLANTGDTDAMRVLGELFISGDGIPVDIETGKQWLIKAAEADDIGSMVKLSEYFLDGELISKNIQEGKKWLIKAAEKQHPRAMQILASRLIKGVGLSKDPREGIRWLKKAAEANDPIAMTILGNKMLYGEGLDKDIVRGELLIRDAIESGDSEAERVLGIELIDGTVLARNLEEGERLIRKSAEGGNEDSMTMLGMRLFEGDGLKQNITEGVEWLNKAIEQNEPLAKVFLGNELAHGKHIQKDFPRGEKLLREAIFDGEQQAKSILGSILIGEENNSCSIEEGIKLIKEASQDGDESAMLKLANILFEGNIVPKDEKEGRRLLRKLVQLENNIGTIELAKKLLYGEGVEKDFQEAFKLVNRLLEKGEGDAASLLGRYYYEHNNIEMATNYMEKGVELNSDNAKNNLSFMIRRGEAVGYSDNSTIKELLTDLIEKNDLFAMINYALCFTKGIQCEKNWHKADEIFFSLSQAEDSPKDALSWWYEFLISKHDDPEGHLVVGWLVRHKFIEDPDHLTVAQRMAKAHDGGWDVPDWMYKAVSKQ